MGRKDHNSSIFVPAWVPPTLFQLPQLHPHPCSKPTYYDSAHLSWCSLVTRISFRTYLVPKSVLRRWLTLLSSCVDLISATCLLSYHELFSTVGSHRSPWLVTLPYWWPVCPGQQVSWAWLFISTLFSPCPRECGGRSSSCSGFS